MSNLVFVAYHHTEPVPSQPGRTVSGFGDTVLDLNSVVDAEVDLTAARADIVANLQSNHGIAGASVTLLHFTNLVPATSPGEVAYLVSVHWENGNGASGFADFGVRQPHPIQIGQDIENVRQFIITNKLAQVNLNGLHVSILGFQRLPADDVAAPAAV